MHGRLTRTLTVTALATLATVGISGTAQAAPHSRSAVTAAPSAVRPAIHGFPCRQPGTYLAFTFMAPDGSSNGMCFADAGYVNVHIPNVVKVCAGNNDGYFNDATNNQTRFFSRGKCYGYLNITVTDISIY